MDKNHRLYHYILGIKFDSTSSASVLRIVSQKIADFGKTEAKTSNFLIVTPNAEQVTLSLKDKLFAKIINSASISLPDGVGILAADEFLNKPVPQNRVIRVPVLLMQGVQVGLATLLGKAPNDLTLIKGRELFLDLVRLANKKSWRVVFLGDSLGSAQNAAEALRLSYKRIKIHPLTGPKLTTEGKPETREDIKLENELLVQINKIHPHLLFIGFGAPKQEKWMYRQSKKLKVGATMVVGGTFDFVSGKTKLPPKWIENMGLEAAWRLITKGQKLGRVLTATVVFPWKIFVYGVSREKSGLTARK